MSNLEFTVIVYPDKTSGYWTEVPALPGCGSQGESIEEAVEMTKDAILGYLASLRKHGAPVPDERRMVHKVTVPV